MKYPHWERTIFPSRKSIHGIIQPTIQFKGGMNELDDFLNQIARFDPTFDKMKYIDNNFKTEKPLESDVIHLPPFKNHLVIGVSNVDYVDNVCVDIDGEDI